MRFQSLVDKPHISMLCRSTFI